jgi:hypothetical protein
LRWRWISAPLIEVDDHFMRRIRNKLVTMRTAIIGDPVDHLDFGEPLRQAGLLGGGGRWRGSTYVSFDVLDTEAARASIQ